MFDKPKLMRLRSRADALRRELNNLTRDASELREDITTRLVPLRRRLRREYAELPAAELLANFRVDQNGHPLDLALLTEAVEVEGHVAELRARADALRAQLRPIAMVVAACERYADSLNPGFAGHA